MPIRSLTDLNNYSLTTITYTDTRPARVYFDRGAPQDQTLSVNENQTYVFPWGINIEDITQYDVALVEYEIDLSNFSTATTVTWDYFPPHCSVSENNNIYTISGIQNRSDWDFVKQARVQAPFGFTGLSPQVGTLRYYEDSSAVTKTILTWDVDVTFIAVEYLSDPPVLTYISNEIKNNISTTTIIADTDEFDPIWTLEITSSVPSAIASMDATANGSGTVAYDSGLKKLTLTGDKTDMNVQLQSIDISFTRTDADFNLQFLLRNSYTVTTEYIVQTVESRDFIMDGAMVSSANIPATAIYRSPANPIMRVSVPDIFATRDANLLPTEIVSVSNLTSSATMIWSPDLTLPVISSWYYPYYLAEFNITSDLTVDGFVVEDFITDTSNMIRTNGGKLILGDYSANSNVGVAKIYDLSTAAVDHVLNNPNTAQAGAIFDQFGFSVDIASARSIVGAYGEDETGNSEAGKAYIFNNSTGSVVHTLDNPNAVNTSANDKFGFSTAISDDYAIVGATGEDTATFTGDSGAAYIFSTSTGSLQHTLLNPVLKNSSETFGYSADITDTHAVVGEPSGLNSSNARVGFAHVYDPSDGSRLYSFQSPSNTIGDDFGWAVALNDTHALISSPGYSSSTGRAYVYSLATGSLVHTFQNPYPLTGRRFGEYIAATNDYFVIVDTAWPTAVVWVYDTSYNPAGFVQMYDLDPGAPPTPNTVSVDGDDLYIDTISGKILKVKIG